MLSTNHPAVWLLLIIGLLISLSAKAQTIARYVSSTGTTLPASATSWASSTTDLQGAIDVVAANPGGGQVFVASGIYKPTSYTGVASRSVSFSMRNGVAIYGGYTGVSGTESNTLVRTTFPSIGAPTGSTLSGDIGQVGDAGDNSYHVILNPNGLTSTAVLDGFVITGGTANGGGTDTWGAGMYNQGSGSGNSCSPTVRNSVFTANSATNGGAIFNDGSSNGVSNPSLSVVLFSQNTAENAGGGIYNSGSGGGISSPTLSSVSFVSNVSAFNGGAMLNAGNSGGVSSPSLVDVLFTQNTARNAGGALYNYGEGGTSSPTLSSVTVTGNGAVDGGGIYNDGRSSGVSSPTLTDCTLQGNTARIGGGISNNVGSPTLTKCTLQGNTALAVGGAIYNVTGSSPTLINCSLQGNAVTGLLSEGGAIYSNGSSLTLINCFLQDNRVGRASDGGAIYNRGSTASLINCTLQDNAASIGGAIFNVINSNTTLTNCVFWNNSGSSFYNANNSSIIASYSMFDQTNGQVNVVSRPGNVAINGSPFASGSLILSACSVAINAGSPDSQTTTTGPYSGTALPQTDLLGNARIIGGRVDMGAAEFTGVQQFPFSFTAQPASGSAICTGAPVSVSVGVSGTGVSYQWYKDGAVLTGNTSATTATLSIPSPTTADAGNYLVVGTAFCNILSSSAFSLTVNPPPSVSLTNNGPLSCNNTSVLLTASAGGFIGTSSFVFSTSATQQGGAGSNTATVNQAGPYSVTASSAGGCVATTQTTVTANELPPTPFVVTQPTADGLVVQVSGGVSYERLKMTDRINGYEIRQTEINQTGYFLITQPGPYAITVVGANGCRSTVTGGR